ncbi:MAG: ribonuclease HII [Faecousia sp.]
MSETDLWEIERGLYQEGYTAVCGIDEAGRGPLAGPVCAGAVILPPELEIPGLNDSKKLTDKKRRALYDEITRQAVAWAVCMVDEKVIDEINILQATFRAMAGALAGLKTVPDFVLVDGNRDPELGIATQTVVKGDARSANVAAASILAKVTRDRFMEQQAEQYPQYGFEIHKGYGTKAHYAALREYGPCPIHRQSFLRSFYGTK